MKMPKRGDIWHVNLAPVQGKEQDGKRYALVVSPEGFNKSGLVMVCPITQGGNQSRYEGFAVSLMGAGTITQGVVMANQLRTVDIHTRGGKYQESVPSFVIDEVLARLLAVLE
jgi:mRNA interferase ChpB